MFQKLLVIMGLLFLVCVAVKSATLNVPVEYPTIQAGIDAAQDGDTVLVADGIYDENDIKFYEKSNIVLRGSGNTTVTDSEKCSTIVDLSKSYSIIIQDLIIDGQSISHIGLNISGGGGITIENCIIKNNTGAGIQVGMGVGLFYINNNTISGNYHGVLNNSSGFIQDNIIQLNNCGIWVSLYKKTWLHRNIINLNNIGVRCECASVLTVCVIIPSSSVVITTCNGENIQIGGSLENANDIIMNSQYGVYNTTGKVINATYNYWGTIIEEEIEAAIDDGIVGATVYVEYEPWTDAGHDQSLAVVLSQFTAAIINKEVMLQWRTESEVNNIGFSIYRNGQKIGFVNGAGNSAMPTNYQFQDNQIEAGQTYLYYLEAIDLFGQRDKSKTIKISLPTATPLPKEFLLLQNYPNPFNPETWIPYQLAQDCEVKISIRNVLGQIIWEISEDKKVGYHKEHLSSQNLASGVYFYTLQAGKFTATRKMVILK